MNATSRLCSCRQDGFILIASLLILAILTILSVSMSSSFNLQELIAGNLREKTRAYESAQSALHYAEYWLNQGNNSTGTPCTGLTSTPVVCSNALANPQTTPWTVGVNYTPPNMNVSSGGGLTAGIENYAANPRFYIQYLGTNVSGIYYRINAVGYGGNSSAIAVIQSTYMFPAGTGKSLGGP